MFINKSSKIDSKKSPRFDHLISTFFDVYQMTCNTSALNFMRCNRYNNDNVQASNQSMKQTFNKMDKNPFRTLYG